MKFIICLIALTITYESFGQEIQLESVLIDSIKKSEREIGTELLKDNISGVLGSSLYPHIFQYKLESLNYLRINTKFKPKPQVSYYYDKASGLIKYVDYNWQPINEVDAIDMNAYLKNQIKESKRFEEYNMNYQSLFDTIAGVFGQPKEHIGELLSKEDKTGKYIERNAEWKTETTTIKLNMIFSDPNKEPEFGMYKIHLIVYWE